MRRSKTILFFALFLSWIPLKVLGQNKNDIIQQRIEFIAEELEAEDVSLEDVFDILFYYYDNPINLNVASREDLVELLMLSDVQINELLEYIKKNGELNSLYQLQELTFWDPVTIDNVMPFVVVRSKKDEKSKKKKGLGELLKSGKTEAYFRWIRGIEERAGYADVPDSVKEQSNSYYWGSPDRLYSRIRYTYGKNLSVGLTMEKDPGEEFFGTTQPYGFDFYSPHAYYANNNKFIRKVALGDYQMELGQGITMWTGYAFNKTVDAIGVRKNARGLRPYASVDETRFLRGAGVEMGINNFSLTAFGSRKGIDGSIQIQLDTLDNEDARLASSINLTGLHRTTSEIERKNSIQETIYGANLNYSTKRLHVGVSAINQMYDTPLERADRPVNQYEFSGNELLSLSADYSYLYKNWSVFGEVAQSRSSGSVAQLHGMTLAVSKRFSLSAVYRNYPKDYHTFYARGFGEFSRTINESGLYFGTAVKLNSAWSFNGYADVFQRPWLSFRVDSPSDGHELLGQLKYRPNPRLELFLRYREQEKMQNARSFEGNLRPVEYFNQKVYRLGFNYRISKSFQWKSRLDYVTDRRESIGLQQGFSLAQDLIYTMPNKPIQISARYAIFDTDGFDTRIFAYESHLQNVFSIPIYFNQGTRAYALVRYTFWQKRCDLWLRYAAFVFSNQDGIGQGPERIEGNVRSEVAVQLRVKF